MPLHIFWSCEKLLFAIIFDQDLTFFFKPGNLCIFRISAPGNLMICGLRVPSCVTEKTKLPLLIKKKTQPNTQPEWQQTSDTTTNDKVGMSKTDLQCCSVWKTTIHLVLSLQAENRSWDNVELLQAYGNSKDIAKDVVGMINITSQYYFWKPRCLNMLSTQIK